MPVPTINLIPPDGDTPQSSLLQVRFDPGAQTPQFRYARGPPHGPVPGQR
jgi:hypothetical protein